MTDGSTRKEAAAAGKAAAKAYKAAKKAKATDAAAQAAAKAAGDAASEDANKKKGMISFCQLFHFVDILIHAAIHSLRHEASSISFDVAIFIVALLSA